MTVALSGVIGTGIRFPDGSIQTSSVTSGFISASVSNLTDSALTSGRVTYAGAGGLLQDSANLTFDGDYLIAKSIKDSALTSGRVTFADTNGLLSDKSTFTFDKLTDTLSVPYIISTAITATDFYGGTFHGSVSGAASKANTLLYNYDSLGTNYVSATDAATGNTIVARDSLGNFSAGTMTGTATRAQYADLAENYLPDALYAPGTVLIFGGDCEVTVSTTPLDTRVAGVVSTNPAHLMNGALTDGVAVALQGRVPCQVVGTIRKGDMLVTSDIPGVATSTATPQLGTIIGKALEDYNSQEVGTIEVVVGRV